MAVDTPVLGQRWQEMFGARAAWRTTAWGEILSEFLGTFVLIAFGDGVVAMAVAALNQSGRGTLVFQASGDWLLVTWGWAMAVMLGVYVAGGLSGAHLNPAVTVALALKRGFPWRKVPTYIAAQVVGAFTAAALVFLNYHDAIHSYERAHNIHRHANGAGSFGIFATEPAKYFGNWVGPFVDQIIGTAFLVLLIFAVVDLFNTPPKANLAPLIVGLIVAAIGMSYGANAGYAINPARDFGPRLFAWFAGWGKAAFPGDYGNVNSFWWIPIVGPLVGGVIGALVYDFFVGHALRARDARQQPADVEQHGRTVEDFE